MEPYIEDQCKPFFKIHLDMDIASGRNCLICASGF